MSAASRLSRRAKAEEQKVEEFARQRLGALQAAGSDVRVLPVAMLTVGAFMAAGMDGAETVADDLEDLARDLRARVRAE